MGFHKKRSREESGFPRLSSLVNAGEYARLWKILPATLLFPLPSPLFLPFAAVLHIPPDVSPPGVSRGARERSLILDSRRTPYGTADTEVVVGRWRIGRRTRSNARSNRRRMDHPLLSARSQPPSPSRQITTSPPAHHSDTKSRRSLLSR